MDTSEDEEELFDVLRPDNYQPTGRMKPRSAVHKDGVSACGLWPSCACCHSHRRHRPSCRAQVTGTVLRMCGSSARRVESSSCSSAPPARSRGPAYGTSPQPATVPASAYFSPLRKIISMKFRALCLCLCASKRLCASHVLVVLQGSPGLLNS